MPAHLRIMLAPVRLLLAVALVLATIVTVGSHPATAAPEGADAAETENDLGLLDGLDEATAGTPADDVATEKAPVVKEAAGGLGVAGKSTKKHAKQKAKRAKQKAKRAKRAGTRSQRGLAIARRQVGDPYSYGAAGPNAFDCSGLVQFSYRAAGYKSIPRTSGSQAAFTKRISRAALKPGDLMFFHSGGRVYHVGIFAGRKNGRIVMLHAPGSGDRVRYASPWTDSWFAGTLR